MLSLDATESVILLRRTGVIATMRRTARVVCGSALNLAANMEQGAAPTVPISRQETMELMEALESMDVSFIQVAIRLPGMPMLTFTLQLATSHSNSHFYKKRATFLFH